MLLIAGTCFAATGFIGYRVVALILLVTVSFIAMLFEILPVLIAAVLSAVIWNFFFIPPLYTFHIDNAEDVLMFLLYFLIALVNAVLTFKIREAENKARDKEEKENTIKLYNTLLSSLSHELRTPISAIIGAVDTLKDNRAKLNIDKQAELLSEIDKAGMRLNRQVENLLNMSRLESGMLKLNLDWCDTNEMVYSVIQKLPDRGHIIKFTPDETLPLYKYDRGLMEQVIQNLLYNALQYTPAGTVIEINCKPDTLGFAIEIGDNGPGFGSEEIDKAFHKFYRLPGTTTGGSGLGLSIVKGFVEAHGGIVKLADKPDGGALFTISIPAEANYLNNLKNE